jgi:hypothetical protein
VAAGTAKLIGTDSGEILAEASRLLDDQEAYQAMAHAHMALDEAGAFDFQLLGRGRRALVLRLEPVGSAAEQHARRAACHQALRAHLDLNGLDGVTLIDDPCPPVRDTLSGKLRRVTHAH